MCGVPGLFAMEGWEVKHDRVCKPAGCVDACPVYRAKVGTGTYYEYRVLVPKR